jgi:hypothetical protein
VRWFYIKEERMRKPGLVVLFLVVMGNMIGMVGCAKRTLYSNEFGPYTLHEAHRQYAELFQMDPSQYQVFLTFENGWWKADVRQMQAMGVNITELCERYCRAPNIKVPFPLLIDYDLLYGVDRL